MRIICMTTLLLLSTWDVYVIGRNLQFPSMEQTFSITDEDFIDNCDYLKRTMTWTILWAVKMT